jgi:ATP-dependent HslUV protease ATP-binding subunit HslU
LRVHEQPDHRGGAVRSLTPKRIVEELDKYIVGQAEAKRTVAIAIRNRWRRQQLAPDIRDDVLPKNIIMIGPTGVGKTEIARRLAQLIKAPFLKVEASKYTEVGYVGRDVESMVRDLVDVGITMQRAEMRTGVEERARARAHDRIADIMAHEGRSRLSILQGLRDGSLDREEIEVPLEEKSASMMPMFAPGGMEQMGIDVQQILDRFAPKRKVTKTMTVAQARQTLIAEEADKLIDHERMVGEALKRVENAGVIFIDELDKVAGPHYDHGPDVSRQGVQRDLLPIVEGSTVTTRYGSVKTDHILFIAAGAFHMSKVSDLIPELQGRFPLRVELSPLKKEDLKRIMTEPRNALTQQYAALLATEGVKLDFDADAIDALAETAIELNESGENIGARRLYTIFEKLLEDPLYDAPETSSRELHVDREFVKQKLAGILKNDDLRRFVL